MEFLGAPIDIKDEASSSAGNWITIPANSLLSGATNLLLQGQTTDLDTGGNSNCELVCRENASGPEVTIIDHDGTSATRSVAVEQAIIPCSSDGSFDIKFTTNGNIAIAHLKIVGYSLGGAASSGAGGLCRLSAAESGYQMFSNGLIMQWMSSPAFTTESSQVVNFPIPFASKPFKVIASTRFPSAAVNTHETMQVVSWNSESVTILAQSITGNFSPAHADIIAIGLALPTDCSGAGEAGAVDGVKISQLETASNLKDDDLFVLSRDDESDGVYDESNKITFQQIKESIIDSNPPVDPSDNFASLMSPSICTKGFINSEGVEGELRFWHDSEWMNPFFNGLSINPLTKEVYERYYWDRNGGKEAFYSRSDNTFYNPHGYTSPSAVMWDNSTPPTFSTENMSAGLVSLTKPR